MLALLVAGLACARNGSSDTKVGAARDSSTAAATDSASNQTESAVTDSSARSTLGTGVEKSRPDQGQPVTAKGGTVNSTVDSSTKSR
jgi:hypothetical protein